MDTITAKGNALWDVTDFFYTWCRACNLYILHLASTPTKATNHRTTTRSTSMFLGIVGLIEFPIEDQSISPMIPNSRIFPFSTTGSQRQVVKFPSTFTKLQLLEMVKWMLNGRVLFWVQKKSPQKTSQIAKSRFIFLHLITLWILI